MGFSKEESEHHGMPPSRWFAQVLMGASYPSEPIVLEELERVLDAAGPTKIDPSECYAIDGSFFIAHAEDCWGDIEIEVDADHATIESETSQRRIAAAEFGDLWTRLVAQEIDQIIRGNYRIEWMKWRNKIIHTTVTDRAGTTIRDTGSRWELLPIPQSHLIHDQFELDYGCP